MSARAPAASSVLGSGSDSVTLTGTLAQINDLLAGNFGATASYVINSDAPPASDTLTLSVDDGGNTGSGGAQTASASVTIDITAVNDAPTGAVGDHRDCRRRRRCLPPTPAASAMPTGWVPSATSGRAPPMAGTTWSAIGGATASTYTLGDADVNALIQVSVAYTDGQGTAESLTSASVGPVANVNDAPTGAVTISGTVTEDQTLTADTSSIGDADGLGALQLPVGALHRWRRDLERHRGRDCLHLYSGRCRRGQPDPGQRRATPMVRARAESLDQRRRGAGGQRQRCADRVPYRSPARRPKTRR